MKCRNCLIDLGCQKLLFEDYLTYVQCLICDLGDFFQLNKKMGIDLSSNRYYWDIDPKKQEIFLKFVYDSLESPCNSEGVMGIRFEYDGRMIGYTMFDYELIE